MPNLVVAVVAVDVDNDDTANEDGFECFFFLFCEKCGKLIGYRFITILISSTCMILPLLWKSITKKHIK